MRAVNRICPDCHLALRVAERQGVEIDFCPQCRGLWLERGELDKILARESEWTGRRRHDDDDDDDDDDEHRRRPYAPGHGHHSGHAPHHTSHSPHRKKRESFLGNLLGDIFD